MPRLEDVPLDDLRRALDRQDRAKPTMRLMVAIAHKQGVSQSELADWYGISRKTVYNWLTRIEERPLDEAVRDDPRPGRPARLDETDRADLRDALETSPTAYGYDADEWSPTLVQRLLRDRFETDYTMRSVRNIVGELGDGPRP